MKWNLIILLGVLVILNSIIISGADFGYNNLGVPQLPPDINYSQIATVNNSDFLDGFSSEEFWQTANNQASLTGNKDGSFDLTTTGDGKFGNLLVNFSNSNISFDEVGLGGPVYIPEISFAIDNPAYIGSVGSVKDSLYIRGANKDPSLKFTDSSVTTTRGFTYNRTSQFIDIDTSISLNDWFKHYFGNAKDVSIMFDGSDMIIDSEDVTANDKLIFTDFDHYRFDNDVLIFGDTVKLKLGLSSDKSILANDTGMFFKTEVGATPFFFDDDVVTDNVGIGTSTPDMPLTFGTDLGTKIRLYRGSVFDIGLQPNTIEFIGPDSDVNFVFGHGTSGSVTTRFYIDGDGKAGINQQPTSVFHTYENNALTNEATGITIEQNGTGDSIVQFLLTATKRWVMGIDNSDGDSFKLATTSDLASNSVLEIETDGDTKFLGEVQFGDALTDNHGINTAPVSNQMLTSNFSTAFTGSGIGYGNKQSFTQDGNAVAGSINLYGNYLDMDIKGTHIAETSWGYGLNIDLDDTCTNGGGNTKSVIGVNSNVASNFGSTYAGFFTATGGTNNYAIWTSAGDIVFDNDNTKLFFGASQDKSILANNTGMFFTTEVGATGYYFDENVTVGGELNGRYFCVDWRDYSTLVSNGNVSRNLLETCNTGDDCAFQVTHSGSLTDFSVNVDTVGVYTDLPDWVVMIEGVDTSLQLDLQNNTRNNYTTQARGTDTFVAGDLIKIRAGVKTGSTMQHATFDVCGYYDD